MVYIFLILLACTLNTTEGMGIVGVAEAGAVGIVTGGGAALVDTGLLPGIGCMLERVIRSALVDTIVKRYNSFIGGLGIGIVSSYVAWTTSWITWLVCLYKIRYGYFPFKFSFKRPFSHHFW